MRMRSHVWFGETRAVRVRRRECEARRHAFVRLCAPHAALARANARSKTSIHTHLIHVRVRLPFLHLAPLKRALGWQWLKIYADD